MPTTMSTHDCRGCDDYFSVSRRRFLAMSGSAAVIASAPLWLPRVAFARQGSVTVRDVIIQVYLRGGCDGLSVVAPYGENRYYAMRPTLALARPDDQSAPADRRCIALGEAGGVAFGLHQSLDGLLPAFSAGRLLVVHAAGLGDHSRSHFDAQKWMEQGQRVDPFGNTGWLGRHLASMPPSAPDSALRALAIADTLQLTLAGAPKSMAASDPTRVAFGGDYKTAEERLDLIAELYGAKNDILKPAAMSVVNTIEQLNAIDYDAYTPAAGAEYPTTNHLGFSLRATAALIKAQIGVEAVSIDVGGWDTHSDQGNFGGQYLFNLLRGVGDALAAFDADLSASNVRYTLVMMSEFGRTASENGSRGTDHGHGNIMFAMGQGIAGGRVLTQWPGMDPSDLDDSGDLQTTIDYRDVLAEIVQQRLGNSDLASVFPGFTPTFRGVTAGAA